MFKKICRKGNKNLFCTNNLLEIIILVHIWSFIKDIFSIKTGKKDVFLWKSSRSSKLDNIYTENVELIKVLLEQQEFSF